MKHIHLIGIGGTGLSAIARVLLERGYTVSGSDREASPLFNAITAAGARTFLGHAAEQVAGADLVIRSSAIPNDNPEVVAAQSEGIPVLKRADFLQELTKDKDTLAVAGSHGKTTTTTMLIWILEQLGTEPSFISGGMVSQLGCNARAGTGLYFAIEADEYDYMFLGLSPKIAIITNIEHDHPDCFPTEEVYRAAFKAFLERVRPDGLALLCLDDPETRALMEEMASTDLEILGYGTASDADYLADDIKTVGPTHERSPQFTLKRRQGDGQYQTLGRVTLSVPGHHNILNATGALAAIHQLELPIPEAILALSKFTGAGRRFEVLGTTSGVTIIDDYGHHPTQIGATIKAARSRYPEHRIWAIWQPHTFSRTKSLEEGFIRALNLADRVLVLKVYASREKDTGYSSKQISEALPEKKAVYRADFTSATDYLLENLTPGDVAIVFSAGDATQISRSVLKELQHLNGKKAGIKPIMAKPLIDNGKLNQLSEKFNNRLHENISMSHYTTAHVGGHVTALVPIHTLEDLIEAAKMLWELSVPFIIMGSGSNILVSDQGLDVIVLHNRAHNIKIDTKSDSPSIYAESGAILGTVARQSALRGLSGLEWAAPVPGTVGGAVYGNAGAHGSDIAANLKMAKILHKNEGIQDWPVNKLAYQYRSSALKREKMPVVILSAVFDVVKTSREEAWEKISAFQAHRKETQPPGASMGSTFKNPAGDFAGRLIEAAGLKGHRVGRAMISPVHANFIINLDGATAQDIWKLMKIAQDKVKEQFGIILEPEIELLGEFD